MRHRWYEPPALRTRLRNSLTGAGLFTLPWFLLLGCISTSLQAQQQPTWAPSYQAAVEHIQQGQKQLGFRELENLGRSFPGDPQLATAIGVALDSDSQYQAAGRWYQKALAQDSHYEPALNNFALNLANRGDLQGAIPLLRSVLKRDPQNGGAAYNLGLIALRVQNYNDAAKAFRLARNAPERPAPLEKISLGEATALFKSGKYAEVVAVLDQPPVCSEIESCLLLGSAQALANELPRAVSTFQAAVRLAPKNPETYFSLALAFLQGKRDQEAKQALAAGLDQIPGSARLLYGQAILFESTGLYDDAVAVDKESIQADPASADAWSLLATVRALQGEDEEAGKSFRRALDLGAKSGTAVEYAELLAHDDRYPEAEKILTSLEARDPGNPAVNRGLGKLYKAEGKLDQAVIYLRRAEIRDPDDPGIHYALATAQELLHQPAEAKREMDLFRTTSQERRFVRVLQIASGSTAADAGQK